MIVIHRSDKVTMPGAPTPTPAATPVLRFENLHMIFRRRLKKSVHALRGLSLTIEAGAVVGLLGPNGSGKTTAISCALGLLLPQNGDVYLWGRRIGAGNNLAGRRYFGVMLEDTRLPPFLSVAQAINLVCRMRGFAGAAVNSEGERVVDLTHIGPQLKQRVSTLSKGQARRVGLAAALVGDPPLLFLDEPSAGLDVASRVEFEELIRTLRNGHRTMLIASHLLGDVQNTCSHAAIINQGRVVAYDSIDAIMKTSSKSAERSLVHVAAAHGETLHGLGLAFAPSKYADLVRIDTELSDAELLRRLLEAGITPRRMEPAVDLISVYLEMTKEGQA